MEWVNPMPTPATNHAPGRPRGDHSTRGRDRSGTMIRHPGLGLPVPIGSLSKQVSPPTWLRPLIAAVDRAALLLPRFLPARLATVALSTVAMAAHPKEGATARGTTQPWAEGSSRYGRHPLDFRICHKTPDAEMIGQMTCACGADDVALFPRPEFKERRFQMIGHTSAPPTTPRSITWAAISTARRAPLGHRH